MRFQVQEVAVSNRLLFSGPAQSAPRELLPALPVPSWSSVRAAWRRYRTRQNIARLNGYLLKDIGVSFADAEAEANKPFWRE
jgi:uncharacterized protein YjiS (DUF1127 family)